MSLICFPMSIGLMSHVDFKKRQCRPVEFKGQEPFSDMFNILPPTELADSRWPMVHQSSGYGPLVFKGVILLEIYHSIHLINMITKKMYD